MALIGGRGFESADDFAAMFAAVIIVVNAVRILRPAVREIMDAAPPREIKDAVRSAAHGVAGVIATEKCHVRKMGFAYYVDLHVTVDGALTVRHGHEIAREVKQAIRTANPRIAEVLVHIEPSDLIDEPSGR